jgi:hypothetical protein
LNRFLLKNRETNFFKIFTIAKLLDAKLAFFTLFKNKRTSLHKTTNRSQEIKKSNCFIIFHDRQHFNKTKKWSIKSLS